MKNKIIFWTTTTLIFLFEGVMPALTFQTEMARNGISHLGYPEYFGTLLAFYKVVGSLILILPFVPAKIKEWAYAGFAFNFISACVSLLVVDGFGVAAFFPIVILAFLILSYTSYQKMNAPQRFTQFA